MRASQALAAERKAAGKSAEQQHKQQMAAARREWAREKREELQTLRSNLEERKEKELKTRLQKEVGEERKRVHNHTTRHKASEFERAAADFRKEKVRQAARCRRLVP